MAKKVVDAERSKAKWKGFVARIKRDGPSRLSITRNALSSAAELPLQLNTRERVHSWITELSERDVRPDGIEPFRQWQGPPPPPDAYDYYVTSQNVEVYVSILDFSVCSLIVRPTPPQVKSLKKHLGNKVDSARSVKTMLAKMR